MAHSLPATSVLGLRSQMPMLMSGSSGIVASQWVPAGRIAGVASV